jgi:3D (Asp-Asp-Asp) domain-containing protein
MKHVKRLCLFLAVLTVTSPFGVNEGAIASNASSTSRSKVISNVYATAYHCVYNSELAGTQTITKTISNTNYTLKASFLFGGWGAAMQGTGRTGPGGDYIKYTGGASCFVRLTGPNAGRNLEGQWVINPKVLRSRYARLGITDFTGFGNLALLYPDSATYSRQSLVTGSIGQPLTPWFSISTDSSIIPPGQTGTVVFKNGTTTPSGETTANFKVQDAGHSINGKHIDIYLGEGQSAIDEWNRTGGNRFVDIYPVR